MAQSVNQPPGLHCLLYLVADRVRAPEIPPRGSASLQSLGTSEHRLARATGKALLWEPEEIRERQLVSLPCRPTVKVHQDRLGGLLRMAALLECRDRGRVELGLFQPRLGWWGRARQGLVWVKPLDGPALTGPAVDGLCGQILKQLEGKGAQGARRLLRSLGGRPPIDLSVDERGWTIAHVEYELVGLGYLRPKVTPPRLLANKVVQAVPDCEQIQTLAEDCALALDRWNRAWAVDAAFSRALLVDCIRSVYPLFGDG